MFFPIKENIFSTQFFYKLLINIYTIVFLLNLIYFL